MALIPPPPSTAQCSAGHTGAPRTRTAVTACGADDDDDDDDEGASVTASEEKRISGSLSGSYSPQYLKIKRKN